MINAFATVIVAMLVLLFAGVALAGAKTGGDCGIFLKQSLDRR